MLLFLVNCTAYPSRWLRNNCKGSLWGRLRRKLLISCHPQGAQRPLHLAVAVFLPWQVSWRQNGGHILGWLVGWRETMTTSDHSSWDNRHIWLRRCEWQALCLVCLQTFSGYCFPCCNSFPWVQGLWVLWQEAIYHWKPPKEGCCKTLEAFLWVRSQFSMRDVAEFLETDLEKRKLTYVGSHHIHGQSLASPPLFKEKKNGDASIGSWDLAKYILEWSEILPDFGNSPLQVIIVSFSITSRVLCYPCCPSSFFFHPIWRQTN